MAEGFSFDVFGFLPDMMGAWLFLLLAVIIYLSSAFLFFFVFERMQVDRRFRLRFLVFDFSIKAWCSMLIPLFYTSPFLFNSFKSALLYVESGPLSLFFEAHPYLVDPAVYQLTISVIFLIVILSTVCHRRRRRKNQDFYTFSQKVEK